MSDLRSRNLRTPAGLGPRGGPPRASVLRQVATASRRGMCQGTAGCPSITGGPSSTPRYPSVLSAPAASPVRSRARPRPGPLPRCASIRQVATAAGVTTQILPKPDSSPIARAATRSAPRRRGPRATGAGAEPHGGGAEPAQPLTHRVPHAPGHTRAAGSAVTPHSEPPGHARKAGVARPDQPAPGGAPEEQPAPGTARRRPGHLVDQACGRHGTNTVPGPTVSSGNNAPRPLPHRLKGPPPESRSPVFTTPPRHGRQKSRTNAVKL
jgi:hypothetical protein